jgi:hypothetical protein
MLMAYGYGYGYGMGSMLVVSVTHTRLRVSGSYPFSVCLAKLTRAQRMPSQKVLNNRLNKID